MRKILISQNINFAKKTNEKKKRKNQFICLTSKQKRINKWLNKNLMNVADENDWNI